MTTRYVGPGGSDANSGLTWALRKLTLNGVEDTPVVAGDIVYVGPGTYRELLTVDVSGTAGNPITYIGDYSGANTDDVGGLVRITGSDNDQTATRANCVLGTTKTYRTFIAFLMDTTTSATISMATGCTNWIIDSCYITNGANHCIAMTGLAQSTNTVQNCFILLSSTSTGNGIHVTHTAVVDNAAHVFQNNICVGGLEAVDFVRVGGCTVKNSVFVGQRGRGVRVETALTGGQTETVNNCIITSCNTAFAATVTGEITENYNLLFGNATDRINTDTGANSVTYPPLFDTRWFFELVSGKGRMLLPFDLASYSQLINLAGTSPSTTDMRGTAVIGAQREIGALEYDPALLFRRVIARQV